MILTWGDEALFWGASRLTWGRVHATTPLPDAMLAHWAIDATWSDGSIMRAWTGAGTLRLEGEDWTAVPEQVLRIGVHDASVNPEDHRLEVSLAFVTPALRAHALEDPGVVRVRVRIVYSADGGASWVVLPRWVEGYLSTPRLVGGEYSFEIITDHGDADRGRPRQWSDAGQQSRHIGDRGFEHTALISQGIDVAWPPI